MKLKRKKCQKWHFFVTPYGTNKMMPQNVKTSNARNYQRELDKILEQVTTTQRLFLHSCCAPCSSYVLEYLRRYFEITVFYYNPNISADEEYQKRPDVSDYYGVYAAGGAVCLFPDGNPAGTGVFWHPARVEDDVEQRIPGVVEDRGAGGLRRGGV